MRALAEQYAIRPTKRRGQNFVIDPNTVRRIVRVAELGPAESVLEVGPGLGSLTLGLLDGARHVTAVEIDATLAKALPATVARFAPAAVARLSVIEGDALQVDASQLASGPAAPPTALVANLPYNVAVPVLLHLLAALPSLKRVLVMVQLEVADRLAARPGSKTYGIPSVKAAWYAEVRRAGNISRQVFWPTPNVDSGLVAMRRREEPVCSVGREAVFSVIDAAFAQRRKMLRAALAAIAGSPAVAESVLHAADIDPTIRGERLEVADFARIAECLGERLL